MLQWHQIWRSTAAKAVPWIPNLLQPADTFVSGEQAPPQNGCHRGQSHGELMPVTKCWKLPGQVSSCDEGHYKHKGDNILGSSETLSTQMRQRNHLHISRHHDVCGDQWASPSMTEKGVPSFSVPKWRYWHDGPPDQRTPARVDYRILLQVTLLDVSFM